MDSVKLSPGGSHTWDDVALGWNNANSDPYMFNVNHTIRFKINFWMPQPKALKLINN